MISAATVGHEPILASGTAKELVRDTLRGLVAKLPVRLRAWVILDNHYHLLIGASRGADLPRFVARLHGSTSHQVNLMDGTPGRRVWDNYWDTYMHQDFDFWSRFNYVHHNPVKHGHAGKIEDWPFSSYHYYLRTHGKEWLDDCWLRYPVTDFTEGIT